MRSLRIIVSVIALIAAVIVSTAVAYTALSTPEPTSPGDGHSHVHEDAPMPGDPGTCWLPASTNADGTHSSMRQTPCPEPTK